ncbi:GtrA family protein [Pseudomonas sp. AIG]
MNPQLLTKLKQLITYITIGTISNIAGYITYLLLTKLGLPSKIAMTILYASVTAIGFYGNQKLTFKYDGNMLGAGARYLIVYVFGYSINLIILVVFSDHLGYNHQIVQAAAIIVVAIYLFMTLKLFVFRRAT